MKTETARLRFKTWNTGAYDTSIISASSRRRESS